MQKHANLVDLVKSFPTNILLQILASIQKRTSPIKFAHLTEKSENGSISNLSTKVSAVLHLTRSDKRIEHRYRAFRGAILAIDGTGLEENPLEPFFGDDSPMMSPGL